MTQLDAMEKMVNEIREALQRRSDPVPKNVNTVRIEGMGAMWNGIAIGIALGAVIVATGWNVSKLQEMNVRSQQSEAYAKAVYMLAPRFAEAIDKELQRDKTIDQEAKDK